jgi:hypothetical protein
VQAFQVVLRDQYRVSNFRTLQPPPQSMSDRRRKIETMYYNSGFSQKTMQPEIRRQLRRSDPERMRRELKRHLLECSRQEVTRLDRLVRDSQRMTPATVMTTLDDVRHVTLKDPVNDNAAIEGVAEANQQMHVEAQARKT